MRPTCFLLLVPFLTPFAQAQLPTLSKTYIVVTDRFSNQIIRYNTDGTLHDNFVASVNPEAVVFGPDQNLYLTGFNAGTVDRFNGDTGNIIGRFITGGSLAGPEGLTFGPDGNLYVVDRVQSAVLRYDGATGAFMDLFVKPRSGGLTGAAAITFGPDGNLYLTSGSVSQDGSGVNNPQVLRYDGKTGAFKDVFISPGSGGLENPFFLLFGPDGNLYISAVTKNSVLRYNGKTGAFIDAFIQPNSGGLSRPTGMAFGPDGRFYVASAFAPTIAILRYDAKTGAFIDNFIREGTGGLEGPTDVIFYTFESQIAATGHDSAVATDPAGNRLVVWVDNDQIKEQPFNASGQATASPRVISSASDRNAHPDVVALDTSSYLVAWEAVSTSGKAGGEATASGSRIIIVPVNGGGAPSPPKTISQPSPGTGDSAPKVAPVKHGFKAAVTWGRTDSTGRGTAVVGRIVNNDGSPSGSEVSIGTPASNSSDESPVIASDGSEGLTIAWQRRRLDNSSTMIVAGTLDSSLGTTSPLNVIDDGTSGRPADPSIGENSSGRTLLVWSRDPLLQQLVSSAGASAKRIIIVPIGGGGAPVTAPAPISADPAKQASKPRIIMSDGAAAGVVWQYGGSNGSGQGVYGRSVLTNGNQAKTEFVVTDALTGSESFGAPAVAINSGGQLTISSDKTASGSAAGIFTRTKGTDFPPVTHRRVTKHSEDGALIVPTVPWHAR